MGSNDGFKTIHAGGMEGDFVIRPLNKKFGALRLESRFSKVNFL